MSLLHVAPGDSAGGGLAQALRDAGRNEEVLRFLDDLSCGPIDTNAAAARAPWWAQFGYDAAETADRSQRFWDRLASSDNSLIVWFSRHSAQELAFFLAVTDRLGDRPYHVLDVTGRQVPSRRRAGAMTTFPARSVSLLSSEALQSLFGKEEPFAAEEKEESRRRWRRLCHENAPLRVVTETGLVSTSIDHFDPLLLARTGPEWRAVARIVAETMGYNSEPYDQVGNVMLWARLVALVEEGRLVADGDPWELSTCIRLPS